MPRYRDDQCVQCGGIRVAKSPLCVDCLVATVNSFAPKYDIMEAKNKELEEKLEMAKATIQRLLDHIAENERYEMDLQREKWETELEGGR